MTKTRPTILLTNDDGVDAPGILAMHRALAEIGRVLRVAPDRDQSGSGHALTLNHPLRIKQVGEAAHAVDGTPTDCVNLGIFHLLDQRPDLVVSGINRGSNLGADILVSGTVGAALQGYLRGFPTLAVSVGSVQSPQFDGAARLLRLLASQLRRTPPEEAFFLNVNLPNLPLSGINGVQITRLGGRSYGESVREEGIGETKRYRISRNKPIPGDNPEGTDIWALKNNRISITPLQVNLTNGEQIPQLETLLADLPARLLQRQD